ncbi:hypothetical protein CKM354_000764300 [Cercospora kikuchii]|uniref:Cytochrome P450 monooxygenase n=1 Tax=Cercospora kikuchii TaxID=84275 RepID=A0A9P3FEI1_9PEZI|nr:uncharacterized protein CKM354_000764300 [Cercospora kikuchii]GIZ44446.1 hypothetical protein CKM354_000764300 [Cercospora kikuchii]
MQLIRLRELLQRRVLQLLQFIRDHYAQPKSSTAQPASYAQCSRDRDSLANTGCPLLGVCSGNDAEVAVRLHTKYGPVVRVAPNKLSFAGERSWKDIYGFRKPGEAPILKDHTRYSKPFNGVGSLVTEIDPAVHARQRKLLSHSFADRNLKELEPLLQQWITLFRCKLEERMRSGENVDLVKWFNCTTFDIMGDLAFNESLGMLENGEYSDWVKAIFGSVKTITIIRAVKIIHWLVNTLADEFLVKSPKVQKQGAVHWNYAKQRVDRRLAKRPKRTDLWTNIVKKRDEGEDGLSTEEQYSNASTFMIAGTETTASALSGTIYYLLRNPAYMDRLVQEIRTSHKRPDDITMENTQQLKYLQAVLKEGLRMYPPVPTALPRIIPKSGVTIDGEFVPEGTVVGVHQMALHRSEALFYKANEFRPERWLGEDPAYQNDCLTSIEPFSTGPRNCIGKNLAWHEMRLILATTLYHFDLHLCEESGDWEKQKVYTFWEKIPLWVTLTPAQQKE